MDGPKRILVTGGGGFLGSHLCDRLLAAGHEVLCVDNFFTGSRRNISHLLGHKSFELMRHDVTFPLYVEVDEIYNLACPASPIHYQYDPVATTKTSVIGAINMLGLAKRLKIKMLQASTSEVYGDPTVHPQVEEYWGNVNPIGLRSCYDEGKRCAETLVFDYVRQHKLDGKVVRIFNTYGPRMRPDDGRVVSNFIVQALAGQDITIYGEGQQTRSFCYVDDLVEALIRMMATGPDVPGPINIGNPNEFTIRQLAELVIELTGAKSKLTFQPLPSDDPTQRQPDITKAQQILDWRPTIELREGLTRTIAYFEESLRGRRLRLGMDFPTPLVRGTLIKRYKRFLADVLLEDGTELTVHCPNPGAMLGLNMPGLTVWLSKSPDPKRKLAWTLELVDVDGGLVGINTMHPNRLLAEALAHDAIPELTGYTSHRREVKYGTNSRVDFLLEAEGRAPCWLEIKNCHLMRTPGLAEFPDCVAARSSKHLKELEAMVAGGDRAVALFVVQRMDCTEFAACAQLDPVFARGLDQAAAAGVEVLAYACDLRTHAITVSNKIAWRT